MMHLAVIPSGTFIDRFRIERPVGSGGAGSVFRALDAESGTPVALKVLHDSSDDCRKRFEREVAHLARVTSPAVARYVAHGFTLDRRPYLAMEWIEGEPLSARLTRGRPALLDAVAIGEGLANALDALHRRGIVHRDVKPGNVMLRGGAAADVVLVDLGISRIIGAASSITNEQCIGTPGYLAPEQARGAADVDERTDVFALGCVLFHCLAGEPPYRADSLVALLLKVLFEPAPRLDDVVRDVPAPLVDLVAAMMERERDRRISMSEVAARLEGTRHATRWSQPDVARPSIRGAEPFPGCLLMLGSVFHPASGPPAPLVHGVSELAQRFGAQLYVLATGTIALSFGAQQGGDDVPLRAAACALAASTVVPFGPRCLVSGNLSGVDPAGVRAMFDRAVELLSKQTSMNGAIHIDGALAGMLRRHFDLRDSPSGLLLVGEAEQRIETLHVEPLVGRQADLAVLRERFDRVVDDGTAGAVVVLGEAGMGKSRLRTELLRYIGARALLLSARGELSAKDATLGAVRALLRTVFAPDPSSGPPSRGSVAARLAGLLPQPNCERTAELLSEAMALPDEGPPSVALTAARADARIAAEGIRQAWLDFVEAEAERRPVALVVEDLQWVDRMSLDLFGRTLRHLAGARIFIVGWARPDIEERLPGLWQEVGATQLRLAPLSKSESITLVTSCLGPRCSPETAARIADRGGGNPFFLEELAKAVLAGETGAMPESVMVAIKLRFKRLGEDARRALRAASVLGDGFSQDDVAALLDEQHPTGRAIGELVDDGVIVLRRRSRPGSEPTYSFRNDLLREAAYALLTPEDRVVGHLLAGGRLEATAHTRAEPASAFAIAQHFEIGQAPERAAPHYRDGARVAFEGNDFEAALALADRALRHLMNPQDRGTLYALRAECAAWSAHGAAERLAKEGVAACMPGSTEWYRCIAPLLTVGEATRDLAKLRPTIELLVAHMDASGADPDAVAFAWAAAIRGLVMAGSAELAMLFLTSLRTLCKGEVSPSARGWLDLSESFAVRLFEGDLWSALRHARVAAAAFGQTGDYRAAAMAKMVAGMMHVDMGEYEEAIVTCESVLGRASDLGIDIVVAQGKWCLGMALGYAGKYREAAEALRAAADHFRAILPSQLGAVYRAWANIHYLQGDHETAERLIRASLDAFRGTDTPTSSLSRSVLARVLVARGRPDEAKAEADRAIRYNASAAGGEAHVVGRVALAEAHQALGDPELARKLAAEARDVLLRRARFFPDEGTRRRFLYRPPTHRRAFELAGDAVPDSDR